MINIILNFYPGKRIKFNQSVLIAEFEQPIKSQQVLNFVRTINARTLIGCNPARKSKIEINLKIISVSNGYRDLDIRVSNTSVFSSVSKT